MKQRVLISIFFIIATTFIALHEVGHVTGEHESASCPICMIDDHTVSADILTDFTDITLFSFETILSSNQYSYTHTQKTANHANAPPKIS